jgi:fructose-bisphosphate aldolase class II
MPLVSLRQALDEARARGYALGAFNVSDVLQAEAVLDAATETRSPVIVQALSGVTGHGGGHGGDARFWPLLQDLIAGYDVPVVLHLDHGPDTETCLRAMDHGFTSVMIDGSLGPDRRPATFAHNVDITARVAAAAHARGVSVEGELGTIGGSEVDSQPAEIVLADPAQAAEFVRLTRVDALAVAIGTSHGAYKFDAPPDRAVLRLDLVDVIARAVPHTHLVMHGSSSLPAELRARVNSFGGTLPESWGVPDHEKVRSIAMGVRKINQGMDSHLAFTGAVRASLGTDGVNVDPAPYLAGGRRAMQRIVAGRMERFGQAGHADDYRPMPLARLARRYQQGR